MKMLDAVEINPPRTATHCIIWLHGLGADGYDFTHIVPALKLPADLAVRFIFPHAPLRPVTLNQGYTMRAWFDIYGLSSEMPLDMAGLQQTDHALHQLIQQQNAAGIPTEKIILAGFSQGGAMALYTTLRYPERLAGVIGLSTFLPAAAALALEKHPSNSATPIFLAHGTMDEVVPFSWGKLTCQQLKHAGYAVTWHSYSMAHTVCEAEVTDIAQFLLLHYHASF